MAAGEGIENKGINHDELGVNARDIDTNNIDVPRLTSIGLTPPPKPMESTSDSNIVRVDGQLTPDARAALEAARVTVAPDVEYAATSIEKTLHDQGAGAAVKAIQDITVDFQKTHMDWASQRVFTDDLTRRLTVDGTADVLRKELVAEQNAAQLGAADVAVAPDINRAAASVEKALHDQGAGAAVRAIHDQTVDFQKTHTDYASQKAFTDGLTKRLTDDGTADVLQKELATEQNAAQLKAAEVAVTPDINQAATSIEKVLHNQGAGAAVRAIHDQTVDFQKKHTDYASQKAFSDGLTKKLTDDGTAGVLQKELEKPAAQ